jgi:hypothetical protein
LTHDKRFALLIPRVELADRIKDGLADFDEGRSVAARLDDDGPAAVAGILNNENLLHPHL